MKIFLDTADLDEIKLACSWGVIDGVTTNPSLIKKAVMKRGGKVTMEEYIKEILRVTPGPVSLEVIGLTAEKMVEQAKMLYRKFSPYGQPVIKIPINPSFGDENNMFDGLKAIRQLSRDGIPVNATLIMSPEQAILAAKAGATYASPFAGRIDDYIREQLGMKRGVHFQKSDYFDFGLIGKLAENNLSRIISSKNADSLSKLYMDEEIVSATRLGNDNGIRSGVDLVRSIVKIFRNYGYKTQVIASSIRNARQVREMAEVGADIVTMPLYVLKQMIQHYKTLEGIKAFTADIVPSYAELFEE
mgnify:FL=1